MRKLPYSEGTVFLVPLRTGGYVRGVVARATKQGKGLLGYFFGPHLRSPHEGRCDDLAPSEAVVCLRFGDLGLINGDWPIIGKVPNWDRSEWPMPDFVRRDPLGKKAWLVRYADDDPNRIVAEYPTDYNTTLQSDSGYGYGAVEIELTQRLATEAQDSPGD